MDNNPYTKSNVKATLQLFPPNNAAWCSKASPYFIEMLLLSKPVKVDFQ